MEKIEKYIFWGSDFVYSGFNRVSGTIKKVTETVTRGSQSREEDKEAAEKTSKRTTSIKGFHFLNI